MQYVILAAAANTLGVDAEQVLKLVRDGMLRAKIGDESGMVWVSQEDTARARRFMSEGQSIPHLAETGDVSPRLAGATGFEMVQDPSSEPVVPIVIDLQRRVNALEFAAAANTYAADLPDLTALARTMISFLNGVTLHATPERIDGMSRTCLILGSDHIAPLLEWANAQKPRALIHKLLYEVGAELVSRARALPGSDIARGANNRVLIRAKQAEAHLRNLATASAVCMHTLYGTDSAWVPAGMSQLDHMVVRQIVLANRP